MKFNFEAVIYRPVEEVYEFLWTLDERDFSDIVFSGDSNVLQEGTSVIAVDEAVEIEAALRKSGKVTVFVRPEDIIVSQKNLASSARNMFKGRIAEVADFGSVVKLRVDAGKEFIVQITKRSFVEMQLNIGSTVFLTFKASSVRVV